MEVCGWGGGGVRRRRGDSRWGKVAKYRREVDSSWVTTRRGGLDVRRWPVRLGRRFKSPENGCVVTRRDWLD